MALLPLLVVLPLLVGALLIWGNAAYDRLLITKVRSDLAVARGYFEQVLSEVGFGTHAVAASHALFQPLQRRDLPAVQALLARESRRLGFDFINLYQVDGRLITADWLPSALPSSPIHAPATGAAAIHARISTDHASLARLEPAELLALAPHLAPRIHIPLIPTRSAVPTTRSVEDRALVMLATTPVRGADGSIVALLRGGVLLNQNLPFIDHINRIVYPEGSLPFGSHGTATLFMDDVRITTNVRLFQDERAIGTRVSQAVREAVLTHGETWLDRAFVVNDWYVSAYEPLLDAAGERTGMLYVGYLEEPFRYVKYGMLALIVGIFLVVMVLAALFSLRWARSIFRPLEQMNLTMQRVEDGDTGARVGLVSARDEIGALAGHLDELLDVIDEKTRALQRWAGELDAKVVERTQELAQSNASLQQAQQQLVKSEKLAAIGQLTASVAHEINNPIAVIQGNLDLMRETLGAQATPVKAELQLLDQQVERMRLIVTQLLQYARPTEYAGYVEAVDVNQTLENSLVLVAHLLARTRIEVERDLQATARAGVNRQELQQVVINLMINAIQAMPEGGRLRLRTRNREDGKTGVLLEISDSGPGLSERVKERLFRPFFTTKNDGNGLGLWISVGLVERYGGSIEGLNRRELGEDADGAVFRVWLLTEPLAPQDGPTGPMEARRA
ncbi:cache domain-containing protein [Rhodoferax sp. BAB1]|nr:cache domain-containing protein [Rhodoferax sp. BAB1]QKO23910.1 cache domain-containing protein [Rhodoferax sp. BAB1]